jgi:hemoglobin-like flavoprotein
MFYARLFQLDPSLRTLFRGDLEQQGRKLMAALDFVVSGLDELPQHLAAVQQLARRHVGYGVQPEHYDQVGQALLWTLAQGIGQDTRDDALQAWTLAYTTVAQAMKSAAWPDTGANPEWQAQAA